MPNGQWSGSTRRRTLPRNWPNIRRAILQRDHYECQIRGPHCTTLANQCDHINSRDDHTATNLQAACTPCHALKSSGQGGRAAQAAKPSRHRTPEPHPGIVR